VSGLSCCWKSRTVSHHLAATGLTACAKKSLHRDWVEHQGDTISSDKFISEKIEIPLVHRSAAASHSVRAVHEEKQRDGTPLGCRAAFDPSHSAYGFWSSRGRCIYNKGDRRSRLGGHLAALRSPLPETIQLAVARLEEYRKAEAAAQRPSLAVVPKSGVRATDSATVPMSKSDAVDM
jgi:hypothetical protein